MAYLLDSDLVIPYLADDPATVPLVERLAPQGITISIVTYMEVYQGTLRSADRRRAQGQFERFLDVVPTLPFSPAGGRPPLRSTARRTEGPESPRAGPCP